MSLPSKPGASALRQAAELIRLDRLVEARALLNQILASDPEDLTAWEYMAQTAASREEEIYCLKRILRLDPGHVWASRKMDQFLAGGLPTERLGAAGQAPMEPDGSARTTTLVSSTPASDPAEPADLRQRRRPRRPALYLAALTILLIVGAWGYFLLRAVSAPLAASLRSTQTAGALSYEDCRILIERAMQAAENYCRQVGPNKVCYGNITLQAVLAPGTRESFSQRGDIIDVFNLLHLAAAPMSVETNEWGIAIFKLLANLPRSLPGELVTVVVFGNTSLENPSQNLQSFYFSSQLGQVNCGQIPLNGILISMPEGAGISLDINDTQFTLSGTASLYASPNESMQINVYSGSGWVASYGQEQYFGGGESVSVNLGGFNGTGASGPPSAPVPLSQGQAELGCLMTNQGCNTGDLQPVSPDQAKTDLASQFQAPATDTPAPSPTGTFTPASSDAATQTPTPSPTATPTATATPTSTPSATSSFTASPTRTPRDTNTPRFTRTPAPTHTPRPQDTNTRVPTHTPRPTHTPKQPGPDGAGSPIPVGTDTPAHTQTPVPTRTNTPVPTHTKRPSHMPKP